MSKGKLTYVYTKSTYRDTTTDTKGVESERLTVYLTCEQALQMADLLTQIADSNEDGIRMVAYTGPRTNNETGEEFFSTAFSLQPRVMQQKQGFAGPARRAASGLERATTRSQPQAETPQRAAPARKAAPVQKTKTATRPPQLEDDDSDEIPF
jgi:hypothetical protein